MVFVAWAATWHDIGNGENTPCLHRWIKEDNDAHHAQDNQTNFHHHRATHLHISEWCMLGCLGDKVSCNDVYRYFLVWRVLTCHVWFTIRSWSRQHMSLVCSFSCFQFSHQVDKMLLPSHPKHQKAPWFLAPEVSPPKDAFCTSEKEAFALDTSSWHFIKARLPSGLDRRVWWALVSSTGLPAVVLLPLLEMYIVTRI